MVSVRESLADVAWRRIGVSVVVVLFLGLLTVLLRQLLLYPVAGWFESALGLYGDHSIAPHRVHDFAFSLLFWVAAVGMLAQLRNPQRHVAGQLMVVVPWISLVLAFALTDYWGPLPFVGIFAGLTVLAMVLHPARPELRWSLDASRVNRVLLALVVLAAVPLVVFAATQVGLQTGAIEPSHDHAEAGPDHEEMHEEHVETGHYALMAAFSVTIIGVGVLASLQPVGWWLPAWVAGGLPMIIGAVSIVYPAAASATGVLWGVAAVLWGVVYIGAAEYSRDADRPTLLGARRLVDTTER